MADPRHLLGHAAEEAAAGWLARRGWRVMERRRRSPAGGEVDIIALDPGRTLVAIEVRIRRSERAGGAAASVDARRVRRLERTLTDYARAARVGHVGLRVDLVAVEPTADGRAVRLSRVPDIGAG